MREHVRLMAYVCKGAKVMDTLSAHAIYRVQVVSFVGKNVQRDLI